MADKDTEEVASSFSNLLVIAVRSVGGGSKHRSGRADFSADFPVPKPDCSNHRIGPEQI